MITAPILSRIESRSGDRLPLEKPVVEEAFAMHQHRRMIHLAAFREMELPFPWRGSPHSSASARTPPDPGSAVFVSFQRESILFPIAFGCVVIGGPTTASRHDMSPMLRSFKYLPLEQIRFCLQLLLLIPTISFASQLFLAFDVV